jgi:hypothetical protein
MVATMGMHKMNIYGITIKIVDDLVNNIDDAECPEVFADSIEDTMYWCADDLRDHCKDKESALKIINRHKARTLSMLQEANCPNVFIRAVKTAFVDIRREVMAALTGRMA